MTEPAGILSAAESRLLNEDMLSTNTRQSFNTVEIEEAGDLTLMSLLHQLEGVSIAKGIIGTLFHQSKEMLIEDDHITA